MHGRAEVEGRELCPGVYLSSVGAALAAVRADVACASEFRLFHGHHEGLSTASGEWCAVACARPLVLKECRSLPTPLWHEVMTLSGGEFATMSALLESENDAGRAPPPGGNGPAFRNTD